MCWKKAKIGELCLVGDGAHASLERVDDGIKYLTSKNFKDGGLDLTKVDFISDDTYKKYFKSESKALTQPQKDDVLFSIIGTIGEPYLVKKSDKYGISSAVSILRVNDERLLPEYLYYWIQGYIFQDAIYSIKGGVAQSYVSLEMIRSLPIYVPSKTVQIEIVSALSAFDDLIENNTRRIAILEEMARLIYREWFVHYRYPGHENDRLVDSGTELGDVPVGWGVKELQSVANIQRGKSYRSKDLVEEGGKPFINLKCFNRGGGFRKSGIKRFKGKYKEEQTVRKDDIVMAITDMTQAREIIARAALVPSLDTEYGVMSMDILKISATKIESDFLYGQLRFSSFPDEVKNYANGANVLHLSPKEILDFDLLFPTKELRKKYAEITNNVFSQIDTLTKQSEKLRETRDLLLPKLISGNLKLH